MEYKITEQICIDEQGGEIKEYGILSSDGTSLENVTDDYVGIQRLVSRLNKEDIPPCHLHDIAEDFICEKATVKILRK